MINSNKIILIIFIVIINFKANSEENKILFSIEEKIYTNIDFEIRNNYLELSGNDLSNKSYNEKLEDYINVTIFNRFFLDIENSKINLIEKQLVSHYDDIFPNINFDNIKYKNLKKKNILNNLRLDLRKKYILEKELNSKKEKVFEENDLNDLIYNYKIKYILFDKNNKDILKNKKIEINFDKIDFTKKILKKSKIDYTYEEVNINNLNNIDKKLRKIIINNKGNFVIDDQSKLMIGIINKQIKKNIDVKLSFFQITTENKFNYEDLTCSKIKTTEENEKIKISFMSDIDFQEVNKSIRLSLVNLNDFKEINFEDKFVYVILCDIKYNKEILKNDNISNNIVSVINLFENEFIKINKHKYKLKIF